MPDLLASRHGGVPAWSPDAASLAIATFTPAGGGGYNGNPRRNDDEPPAAFADADDHVLWRVVAPRAVDEQAASLKMLPAPDSARWAAAFDQVWLTLKSMYYASGPSAVAWDALRAKYRPRALEARDAAQAEQVIDELVAEQPLIKDALESPRGVVASGHPLASAAGALVLAQGGNVVDAGIAVSFALGVVEPDASSIGGDGQAILFLKGMSEPIVIEYKDMTPSHATPDNPKLFTPTGGRTAADGPTVAAIPGVVAGHGSAVPEVRQQESRVEGPRRAGDQARRRGIRPRRGAADDDSQGRESFAKYPESAKVFMPGGRVPRPGERVRQQGLRRDAAHDRRRGRAVVLPRVDCEEESSRTWRQNGGVITAEDLAQYRAMERKPLAGQYRGHLVYSVPAPVSHRPADRRDAEHPRSLPAARRRDVTRRMPTTSIT